VQPNRILGVVGDNCEDFPIEGIRCSRDRRILGSYSHDETVRFTDISMISSSAVGINIDEDGE
jgi:hypothetical protein